MSDKILKELLEIIEYGEGVTTEFKEAKSELPKKLFETICAFLNRNGGHIFLGISDKGEIIGIDERNIKNMKKNFISLCNNSQKIEPTVYLNIREYEIRKKKILYIYVHESSEVHRTNGIVFDRNEDGDYKVTLSPRIANIYIRKQTFHAENRVFPYANMSDLREDLIKRARQMTINNSTKNHVWLDMSNEEMLRSLNFFGKDLVTGKEGLTLAAILLFGKDETILSALPHHKTDAIYRVENLDRYDDRDDIRTNLLESYDRLIAFIDKHLDDKFYLEGTQRIDVRNKIARELCTNLLIHREFLNPYPAKLIIEKNCIRTENANRAKMIGELDVNSYEPYPKNPKLAKFFKEVGLADELGSGVKNIVKYTKIYSGGIPEFKEGDIFRTRIPLVNTCNNYKNCTENYTENCTENYTENYTENFNRTQKRILELIQKNTSITQRMMMEETKLSRATITLNLKQLKDKKVIKRIGSDRKGYWKILKS